MKKKKILIILFLFIIVITIIGLTVYIPLYKEYKAKKEEELRIANATIIVELKEDLTAAFYSDIKVSDFIENINGELIEDFQIDTTNLGEKVVKFKYVNDEDITIPYKYIINIVDNVPPSIWLSENMYLNVGATDNLLANITCVDNLDDDPYCEIIGEYDLNAIGNYPLTIKATDASGNETIQDFTLHIKEPSGNSSSSKSTSTPDYFSDIVAAYKTADNIKVGIDVSSWQGDIDFEQVKNDGCEFAFIRVGSTRGIDGEYFEDSKFQRNIEGFTSVGIPVGIYFYSYAKTKEAAINDAKWVIEHLDGYKIDLGVAYDFESWSFYNEYHQSFYTTTMNAKAFLDTLKDAGYTGINYSSKRYLETVWYPLEYDTWLAHYTKQTTYAGKYKYWQLTSTGKIDGIKGYVDIDLMYE